MRAATPQPTAKAAKAASPSVARKSTGFSWRSLFLDRLAPPRAAAAAAAATAAAATDDKENNDADGTRRESRRCFFVLFYFCFDNFSFKRRSAYLQTISFSSSKRLKAATDERRAAAKVRESGARSQSASKLRALFLQPSTRSGDRRARERQSEARPSVVEQEASQHRLVSRRQAELRFE